MRRKLNKKGFTLVELMIVVVILGILVLVAIPIFTVVTKGAKTKTCEANMRIIRGNLVEYMMLVASQTGEPYTFDSFSEGGTNVAGILKYEDDFLALFDGGEIPMCSNGNVPKEYAIKATGPNTFYIECKCDGCPNKGNRG